MPSTECLNRNKHQVFRVAPAGARAGICPHFSKRARSPKHGPNERAKGQIRRHKPTRDSSARPRRLFELSASNFRHKSVRIERPGGLSKSHLTSQEAGQGSKRSTRSSPRAHTPFPATPGAARDLGVRLQHLPRCLHSTFTHAPPSAPAATTAGLFSCSSNPSREPTENPPLPGAALGAPDGLGLLGPELSQRDPELLPPQTRPFPAGHPERWNRRGPLPVRSGPNGAEGPCRPSARPAPFPSQLLSRGRRSPVPSPRPPSPGAAAGAPQGSPRLPAARAPRAPQASPPRARPLGAPARPRPRSRFPSRWPFPVPRSRAGAGRSRPSSSGRRTGPAAATPPPSSLPAGPAPPRAPRRRRRPRGDRGQRTAQTRKGRSAEGAGTSGGGASSKGARGGVLPI